MPDDSFPAPDFPTPSRARRRAFLRRSATGVAAALLARDAHARGLDDDGDGWQLVPGSDPAIDRGSLVARTVAMPSPESVVPANPADNARGLRRLTLVNDHTGDTFDDVYCTHGVYDLKRMEELAYVMRDHRANAEHVIDPELLDLLVRLHARLDTDEPLRLLSGYRTKQTNDRLRSRSTGVALHSLHMEAKAADIHVPGIATKALRLEAMALRAGGVGYYSRSGFVHVDTGQVRHWGT